MNTYTFHDNSWTEQIRIERHGVLWGEVLEVVATGEQTEYLTKIHSGK